MTRITPERIHSFNAFEAVLVISAAVATPSMFITSDIALFALCLACVARAIPWRHCAAVVLIACMMLDRVVIGTVDYSLLATFIHFFVLWATCSKSTPWRARSAASWPDARSWQPRRPARP